MTTQSEKESSVKQLGHLPYGGCPNAVPFFLWSGLRDSLGSLSRSPTRTRPPKQPPAVSLLRNGLFEPRNPYKRKKEAPKCFFFFMERITRHARLAFALADTHTAAETAPGCFFASQRPFRASNPYKRKKEAPKCFFFFMERITRLELATSTLARWRSTG